MSSIRTAIIGYGVSASCFHLPVIRSVDAFDVCVVVSSDPDKVRRDLPHAAVYPTVETMLATARPELAIVTTPNALHAPLAAACLDGGCHVVVDKPFIVGVAEGTALIGRARERNRLLTVYQSRRWDGDFLTLKALIRSGRLGRVHSFQSNYDRYRPDVKDRWRERDEPGAGILYDLGAHLIDQALVLFGLPECVDGHLRRQRANARVDDHFHLILSYPETEVILHADCLTHTMGPRFQVMGDRGSFIKWGMDPQEAMLRERCGPGTPGWGEEPAELFGLCSWQDGADAYKARIPTEGGCVERFYRKLADAIHGEASVPVAPETALDVIRVIEAARLSHNERRSVRIER